eukprot:8162456-Alexandrium_andersonii.AAC.1
MSRLPDAPTSQRPSFRSTLSSEGAWPRPLSKPRAEGPQPHLFGIAGSFQVLPMGSLGAP